MVEDAAAQIGARSSHQRQPHHTAAPNELIRYIRRFIEQFMDCRACVDTFLAAPYDEDAIETHRDAILWMWRAHNYVNGVVRQQPFEEKAFAEDPAFLPKHYWPPRHLCHQCYRFESTVEEQAVSEAALHLVKSREPRIWVPIFDEASCDDDPRLCPKEAGEWNFDAVFEFLVKYYGSGKSLDSPQWGATLYANVSTAEVSEVQIVPGMADQMRAWPQWGAAVASFSWIVAVVAAFTVVAYLNIQHVLQRCPRLQEIDLTVSTAAPVLHRVQDVWLCVAGEVEIDRGDDDREESVRLMADDMVCADE
jgi:hypothetical protein